MKQPKDSFFISYVEIKKYINYPIHKYYFIKNKKRKRLHFIIIYNFVRINYIYVCTLFDFRFRLVSFKQKYISYV